MSAIDITTELQADLAARCQADPYLEDVVIVMVNPGDVEADIRQKLATLLGSNGKRGLAVLVLPIEDAADPTPNIPGSAMVLDIAFQVIEAPLLNQSGSGGTGKPGRKVARRLRDLFKCYTPVGFTHCLNAEHDCIRKQDLTDRSLRGWLVSFTASEADDEVVRMLPRPLFQPAGGTTASVIITNLEAGSTCYYTTDGSYPSAQNIAAQLYSGAIAISESVTLRACAFKEGCLPSDVNLGRFTPAT